jgi:hypothetical protein
VPDQSRRRRDADQEYDGSRGEQESNKPHQQAHQPFRSKLRARQALSLTAKQPALWFRRGIVNVTINRPSRSAKTLIGQDTTRHYLCSIPGRPHGRFLYGLRCGQTRASQLFVSPLPRQWRASWPGKHRSPSPSIRQYGSSSPPTRDFPYHPCLTRSPVRPAPKEHRAPSAP